MFVGVSNKIPLKVDPFEIGDIQSHFTKNLNSIIGIDLDDMILNENEDIDDSHLIDMKCCICMSIIFNPCTTNCGHTFCNTCIMIMINKQNRVHCLCPMCFTNITALQFNDTIQETIAGRLYNCIECNEIHGIYENCRNYIDIVKCIHCMKSVNKFKMLQHLERKCSYMHILTCNRCGERGYNIHLGCHQAIWCVMKNYFVRPTYVKCEYCNDMFPRNYVKSHQEHCKLSIVKCKVCNIPYVGKFYEKHKYECDKKNREDLLHNKCIALRGAVWGKNNYYNRKFSPNDFVLKNKDSKKHIYWPVNKKPIRKTTGCYFNR
jgi:hypothetical protein